MTERSDRSRLKRNRIHLVPFDVFQLMCSIDEFEVIYCVTLVVRNHNTIHLYSEETRFDFNRTVKDFSLHEINDSVDVWVNDVPIGNRWCRNAFRKRMYKWSTWPFEFKRKSKCIIYLGEKQRKALETIEKLNRVVERRASGSDYRWTSISQLFLSDIFHCKEFSVPRTKIAGKR